MNPYDIIQGTSTDASGNVTSYIFQMDYSATSTPGQVQTNLFYGFILFFMMTALIVGYFNSKFKKG